jgi:hypothetical protein
VLALEDANVADRVTNQPDHQIAADHVVGVGAGQALRLSAPFVRSQASCPPGDVHTRHPRNQAVLHRTVAYLSEANRLWNS